MQKELSEQEKTSWEKIGEIIEKEMSNVDDVRNTLARTEKGGVKQSIDNCMIVLQRDHMLRSSICKNELTGKIDIVKDLGWKRKNSSIVDTDIYQIQHYLENNYGLISETHPEDRPRQCVFVGTSNSMDFLPLDRSGNRRFAPILVHPENIQKHILEDEREASEYILQAWAEAMERYKESTHELKLSKESETYLKVLQQQFMPEDTKVGIIQAWLDAAKEDYVCSIMIYREALRHNVDEPKQWETREINNIMNESIIGWKPIKSTHRFGDDYGIQRGWKRETDENGFMQLPEDTTLPFDS